MPREIFCCVNFDVLELLQIHFLTDPLEDHDAARGKNQNFALASKKTTKMIY